MSTPWRFPDYDAHETLHFVNDQASGLCAIIAIHSTHLGPAAGGARFWHYAEDSAALIDALRLSRGMSYKNAMAGLPLGGGKAVTARGMPRRPKCRASAAHQWGFAALVTAEESHDAGMIRSAAAQFAPGSAQGGEAAENRARTPARVSGLKAAVSPSSARTVSPACTRAAGAGSVATGAHSTRAEGLDVDRDIDPAKAKSSPTPPAARSLERSISGLLRTFSAPIARRNFRRSFARC